MTAPRRPSEQATIRGAIVVFIAVLVGVALLSRSDGGLFGSASAGGAGPTTTTTASTEPKQTTTTATVPNGGGNGAGNGGQVHPAGEVKVIVLNAAGGIPGIGSENSTKIQQAGFASLPVKNAGQDIPTTGLFYGNGYQADAAKVKQALGFGDVPVQPSGDPIIPEAAEANVVVVLGQDYQSVTG